MLKALLKKQFIELFKSYFVNRKTGKARSRGGVIGYFILFAVLMLLLAISFYGMSMMLVESFCTMELDWLYFALIGLMSTLLGTFGSVFNTYTGIYQSKDNEMLLSMPIKPSYILFSRIAGVYVLGLLYEALMLVPSTLCYWINCPAITSAKIISPIILIFVLAFFISALTCLLGWIVALISGKIKSKNKNVVTIITSLVFFAFYYFVCMRFSSILTSIVENATLIGEKIKYVFPAYAFGMASIGSPIYLLLFILFSAVCFGATYFVMSKSFIKIATGSKSAKKTVYTEKKVSQQSSSKALLMKEFKRFTSSPTYFMNCGIGLFIMPVVGIIALVKGNLIIGYFDIIPPELKQLLPVAVAVTLGLIGNLNNITSPSISLEGKNLWILQSLPVDLYKVLQSKIYLHTYLNSISAIISAVMVSIAFKLGIVDTILICAMLYIYTYFGGTMGLILNLKMPNLTWTNEVVPIKQGMPVMICVLGGWFVSAAIGGVAYLLKDLLTPTSYLAICTVFFSVVSSILDKWLKKKGTEILKTL